MARGSINHVALTASDFARSTAFYDKVLGYMGYVRGEVPESTQQLMKTALVGWGSANGSVTLRPAKSTGAGHDRDRPGMNHLAFSAAHRPDVDRMYELLKEMGAQVLDAPAEYPYFPGYYAVYFTDPDGMKIEFVYCPSA
jgi:glyoxylase I family protein